MGHGSSKSDLEGSSSDNANGSSKPSLRSRFSAKFHERCNLRRHSSSSSSSGSNYKLKLVNATDFAGIALIELISAEMKFKDKWFACVTFGERTFRTATSDHTEKPVWKSEKKLLLESNGPHVARISVFETNRLLKNNLIGYCEVDILEVLTRDSDSDFEVLDLLDPSSSNIVVGSVTVSCSVEDSIDTERSFARRILSVVSRLFSWGGIHPWVSLRKGEDSLSSSVHNRSRSRSTYQSVKTNTVDTTFETNKDDNQDGMLSFSEFADLMNAFGNQVADIKKEELFKQADQNGDGAVSMDELANLLAVQQEKESLISNCPVCGDILGKSDKLNDMIHITLCFDEGTGNQVMSGAFLTEKQASYGWLFKMSEWAHCSSYDVGLNSGSSASSILVFDRKTKRLVEERIDGKIILSMRAIYQSKVGLSLIDKGAKDLLKSISEKQGRRMNSVDSIKEIPKFIEFFKDQLNMDDTKYPLEHFKTFNEFFIRELKPGSRPIAFSERDDTAVCAADSRLIAFKSAEDSLRFWIKGRKFSIQGLLGTEVCSTEFINGSLVIFRLAPQDYHRFHFPVSGTVEKFVDIPGSLYTVNPIAVNSKYCNVFTENKRVVSVISTADFGKVAFVAIGATMVGSITFTKKKGDYVNKGDEFGYFSFGGSTVICVFEKDAIEIDVDLIENSERSLETLVSVGMTLGVSKKKRNEA